MNDGSRALLERALALFNDRPNYGLRRDPSVTSYKLAADIERCLTASLTASKGQ